MGNDGSPGSQDNVWRHHNLGCSKAGNSELEAVIRNIFKHSRYYASSGYLQEFKKIWIKIIIAEETGWNYIFQMLKGR